MACGLLRSARDRVRPQGHRGDGFPARRVCVRQEHARSSCTSPTCRPHRRCWPTRSANAARLTGRAVLWSHWKPCPPPSFRSTASPAPCGRSSTRGSRSPTGRASPRGSGCPRTPSASRCRRSSSTSRTASATARAAATQPDPPLLRRPRLRRASGSTCAGIGDSDGVLLDEYLPQEQDDALEVIAWLAAQPWCTGAVGMIGHLLGRLQRAPGRGAPAARAEGDHHALLDRRPLRRRRPLHGRLPARTTSSAGPRRCSRYNARPPDPAIVGRALARACGSSGSRARRPSSSLARPPAPGRVLEARLGVRGLWRDPVPGLRDRRLGGRLLERGAAPARGARRARARGWSVRGRTRYPAQACPGRRSASCRRRCAGGTTG